MFEPIRHEWDTTDGLSGLYWAAQMATYSNGNPESRLGLGTPRLDVPREIVREVDPGSTFFAFLIHSNEVKRA